MTGVLLPDAVLFDLDGTLVDTSALWQAAYRALARELDVTLPADWWEGVRGRSLAASLAVFSSSSRPAVGGVSLLRDGAALEHDAIEDEALEREAPEREARLVELATQHLGVVAVTWLPGARDLLAAVQAAGVSTGVVTSTWRGLTDAILAAAEVTVTVVVGGDEVANGKPAGDIYLAATERLGVAPARCLAVEDSPTGVAAAEAAGIPVLVVPSAETLRSAPGRTLVNSLAEVVFGDLAVVPR